MSGWKKLAAASAAGGGGLNVEDVFSTYLWNFSSAPFTVNNGIDLDGEGGLVWVKGRTSNYHWLHDSERGVSKALFSNSDDGEYTTTTSITSFNSNGFTVGGSHSGSVDHASWTFRKAPKFFDVVTYTGDGVAGRTVAHNLGSAPGCIILKCTSAAESWHVYHRGNNNGTNPEDYYLKLNGQNAKLSNIPAWNDTAPTDSVFSLGDDSGVNGNGATFVAYLFAHNDGDGEFGPDGGQDIIKCDKYLGGAASKVDIDCGFEPSWVMIKSSNESSDWVILDNMRGVASVYSGSNYLEANTTNAEAVANYIHFTPTGFQTQANNQVNAFGGQYTFIAIRRGTKVPESGTEVFDIQSWAGNGTGSRVISTSLTHDVALLTDKASGAYLNKALYNRMTGTEIYVTHSTQPDSYWTGTATKLYHDIQEGIELPSNATQWNSSGDNFVGYFWRRTPNYFDVVAYTSNVSSGTPLTLNHNLNAAPEMMWCKKRSGAQNWWVYHKDSGYGSGGYLNLNKSNAAAEDTSDPNIWNSTDPTETTFTVGSYLTTQYNTYIAYLFASLPGISKVGSYTGNGSSQTIDCGFSSGARFILVKRTDSSGNWYVWDTERGIVAGNDPYLSLNTASAEVTNTDWVDPDNSGFIVNGTTINASSASYIFYAIA